MLHGESLPIPFSQRQKLLDRDWFKLTWKPLREFVNSIKEARSWEGVIVCNGGSVGVSFGRTGGRRVGCSRHVKNVFTIDRVINGVCCEVSVSGEIIRQRPSKIPNTAEEIANVISGCTIEGLLAFSLANGRVIPLEDGFMDSDLAEIDSHSLPFIKDDEFFVDPYDLISGLGDEDEPQTYETWDLAALNPESFEYTLPFGSNDPGR